MSSNNPNTNPKPQHTPADNNKHPNSFYHKVVGFIAGDTVLCPSIGDGVYTLHANGSDTDSPSLVIYDDDNDCHAFYPDGRIRFHDVVPSLFYDTPANRQAIATLYDSKPTQTSQRKVIDTTAPNDNEVILLSSHDLSHIACDISGAITVLHDVGHLLALIHYEKIDTHTAISMARLAHDAADTWADLLHSQVKSVNKPLAQTAYAKEVDK